MCPNIRNVSRYRFLFISSHHQPLHILGSNRWSQRLSTHFSLSLCLSVFLSVDTLHLSIIVDRIITDSRTASIPARIVRQNFLVLLTSSHFHGHKIIILLRCNKKNWIHVRRHSSPQSSASSSFNCTFSMRTTGARRHNGSTRVPPNGV